MVKVTTPGMDHGGVLEAVCPTLVQSHATYSSNMGIHTRRDPECRPGLFGLGENKGIWDFPFCSWENRLLAGQKLDL